MGEEEEEEIEREGKKDNAGKKLAFISQHYSLDAAALERYQKNPPE